MDLSWLKAIAPTLVTALGGPLAGVAYEVASKVMGKPVEEVKDILAAGSLTSGDLASIKLAELELKAKEDELGFKFAELEFKDRDSARQMQAVTKSVTPSVLTYLITAGFFATLGGFVFGDVVAESPPLLIMLGALGSEFGSVCKFWFGANSGSDRTKELLAQAQPIKPE